MNTVCRCVEMRAFKGSEAVRSTPATILWCAVVLVDGDGAPGKADLACLQTSHYFIRTCAAGALVRAQAA